MTKAALYKKIEMLDAHADAIKNIVTGLRSIQEGVSTPSSFKGLSKEKVANIIAKRRKVMLKPKN